MLNLTTVVGQLKKERERARKELDGLDSALKVLGTLVSPNRRSNGWSDGRQEAEDHVSGCPQTNRSRPARPLGEMEGR